MSTAKTRVDQKELQDFFEHHLNLPNATLETIEEGETSQAYFYDSPDGPRVLRINSHTQEGFLKDDLAAKHFANENVPIPLTYEVGEISPGVFFSITARAKGRLMSSLTVEETNAMMPEIIKTMDVLHATPPLGNGYGSWDLSGNGRYNSWAEAIKAMQVADDDDKLAEVAFFDQTLHDTLRAEVNRLLVYCPEQRVLLHGDFGYKNALTDGKKITGVIDWHSSMYGDPLFEVVWLEFWREQQRFAKQFREHYASTSRDMRNFDERLRCYMLLISLSAMAFFAKSDQQEKYEFSRQRLQFLN